MIHSLDPLHLAQALKSMTWPELDQVAHQIVARMTLLAEAPGAPTGRTVSSGKPGSAPPRGDRALADEHHELIDRAVRRCLADRGVYPEAYARAIMRAAIALRCAKGGGQVDPEQDPNTVTDPERIDRIIDTYEGVDPHYAAAIESAQGGWITAGAIRSARNLNARHRETGLPVPVGDDLKALVRTEAAAGTSQRDLARRYDVAQSTVGRILDAERMGSCT